MLHLSAACPCRSRCHDECQHNSTTLACTNAIEHCIMIGLHSSLSAESLPLFSLGGSLCPQNDGRAVPVQQLLLGCWPQSDLQDWGRWCAYLPDQGFTRADKLSGWHAWLHASHKQVDDACRSATLRVAQAPRGVSWGGNSCLLSLVCYCC